MDKKAISIMIGYVLLITTAVVMSGIVYTWLKTYVPKPVPECPDGVSIMIKEMECDETNSQLKLKLKNNGLFSIDGYFIRGAKTGQEIATIDLSGEASGFTAYSLEPTQEDSVFRFFNFPEAIGENFSIEIIPIRIQIENNKKRFVTCGDATIKERVNCEAPVSGEIPPPSPS